jgi:hypothetical protein
MKRLRRVRLERIEADDAPGLLTYFRGPRPAIFRTDHRASMKAGFREDLRTLWASLPPAGQIGRDDFVDLLTVRTRFPNQAGYEQARLDERVVGFAPYAQPSFLRCLFYSTPDTPKSRRHFQDIIRRRDPALAAYPLVKGASVYPFQLPDLAAAVWTRLLTHPHAVPRETTRQRLFATLKPFILDLAHSDEMASFSAYDPSAVRSLVTRYYDGEGAYEGALDWWLAFELWRQSIRAADPS